MTARPVLRAAGLVAGYGGVPVVHGLDLTVAEGEVVALLGPNGAGKSTTLRTVSGLLVPLGGELEVLGAPVPTRRPHAVARRGVGHVTEDRSLFHGLTVRQNLRLGAGRGGSRRRGVERVLELFPELGAHLDRRAGLLSGGQQQMLAIGRALVAGPRLLLIDEMSLGLAPVIAQRLVPVVRDVADSTGAGVVLVEQHVPLALAVADRVCVLVHGEVALAGVATDLDARRDVLAGAYLGT